MSHKPEFKYLKKINYVYYLFSNAYIFKAQNKPKFTKLTVQIAVTRTTALPHLQQKKKLFTMR